MSSTEPSIAIPGQNLGPLTKYIPGPGTHIHNSNLHASILGFIHISTPPKPAGPQKRPTKITPAPPALLPTLSVHRSADDLPAALPSKPGGQDGSEAKGDGSAQGQSQGQGQGGNGIRPQQQARSKSQVLPEVNSVVLCRVTRIATRQATVAILVVGDTVLEGEWQGLIRVQDVRATEKDRVKILESFRPGDVVRAVVISLGDQANYYLSTASNNLGVIMATSEAGNAMYPVSWREYRDPETGLSESRKVAKPF